MTTEPEYPRALDYICMQPTREGQASHAHVYEIVAGLRRRGWTVRLVEPPLPRPGRLDGIRRAINAIVVQARYWWECRFRPSTVVYIRSHFLAFPTALLARLRGAAVIQEINGGSGDAYDAWPHLRLLAPLLSLLGDAQVRWADAVIVVTPGLAEGIADGRRSRGGIHVVGNGANADLFRPRSRSSQGPDRPYIVFVGALASWQGIDVVLEAAGSQAWPEGVEVRIAGDGVMRGRVVATVASNSLVRWLGVVPYADVPPLVANSSAALVPMVDAARSSTGLSPLKLFEAMASGVPVIASDLPGIRDVVEETGCGLLFPSGDALALAQRAAEIVRNPERAAEMGRAGRLAVEDAYSWDARASQTERVIVETLAARAR